MKRFFTLTLLMAFGLALVGAPLDEATAKQFAQNFWKKNNTMGVRDGKVYRNKTDDAHFVNIAPQLGYSELFIFNNVDGKGFVIMAADDCVTPILGYSYENNITDGTLPPNLKALLDGYAEEIRAAVAMKAAATDEIRADWASLKQGKPLPIKSENDVNHLVQTNWDQSPYYNDQCPYDNNDHSRTLTGCVATAMAQVMKFWNYPEHGLGSHSYVPSSHPEYGTLYVDFSAVNYQWSAMPNVVNSANSAVATLMYHCGVAVDMMYGISGAPDYGSAAYIIDYGGDRPCAETALKTYFNYKNTLRGVEKNNYTDSQWIALLKGELDNSRPMVYGGFSNSGGHAFVCDGYDYRDYFHFNWGWGGYYNGNFYINELNPGTHNYSRNQQAIVGIEPNTGGGGGGG
ncbi:MAG: C10 family peptidase, partial [Bacteroidales bacterium]|nr:C10 family peptidase [Bacteroidales bacterium]